MLPDSALYRPASRFSVFVHYDDRSFPLRGVPTEISRVRFYVLQFSYWSCQVCQVDNHESIVLPRSWKTYLRLLLLSLVNNDAAPISLQRHLGNAAVDQWLVGVMSVRCTDRKASSHWKSYYGDVSEISVKRLQFFFKMSSETVCVMLLTQRISSVSYV